MNEKKNSSTVEEMSPTMQELIREYDRKQIDNIEKEVKEVALSDVFESRMRKRIAEENRPGKNRFYRVMKNAVAVITVILLVGVMGITVRTFRGAEEPDGSKDVEQLYVDTADKNETSGGNIASRRPSWRALYNEENIANAIPDGLGEIPSLSPEDIEKYLDLADEYYGLQEYFGNTKKIEQLIEEWAEREIPEPVLPFFLWIVDEFMRYFGW